MLGFNKFLFVMFVAVSMLGTASANEVGVGQKNKQFTMTELEVKVGEAVRFTNEDPFFHNVFSLSEAKTFDLGSFPKGQSKVVTFDTAGEVDVECAIHPKMQMKIKVVE